MPVTDKIDFKKALAAYRARRGTFRVLDVPDMRHLILRQPVTTA
jgi:hypothetical protein